MVISKALISKVAKELSFRAKAKIVEKGLEDIQGDNQVESLKSSQGIIDNPFNKDSWVKGIAFIPYDTQDTTGVVLTTTEPQFILIQEKV